MRNVWYTIVKFFKELFAPPESSTFERFLVAQVSHLESELARERERYDELLSRFIPALNRPEPNPSDVKSITAAQPTWQSRKAQLESLSEQRAKKAHDERWAQHIANLEAKNANLEVQDKDKLQVKEYVTAPENNE